MRAAGQAIAKLVALAAAVATLTCGLSAAAPAAGAAARLSPPASRPVLHVGSHGFAVRWLQQRLGVATTGRFTVATKHRVQTFQRRHHLSPTGVVRASTWRALLPAPAKPAVVAAPPAPVVAPTPVDTPTPVATPTPADTPTPVQPAPAPALASGQTTVTGLLPDSAVTFPTETTGWASYAGGTAGWIGTAGRTLPGALTSTSAGAWTGVASPRFAVTAGARYSATAWAMAGGSAQSVGLALQFYDRAGNNVTAGNQVGQGLVDSTSSWTQTAPVIGFAPDTAVTAAVAFLDFDGLAGDVQWLDDVTVARTTGVAAPIVGPLTTSGNQVIDGNGFAVRFHGIDLDGLQYSPTGITNTAEVGVAQRWGANFVRIPLAENYLLDSSCGYDTGGYLARIDALVAAATSRHMFVMLDLHTNAVVPCAVPAQQRMPDQESVTFWQTLAGRYMTNPLVGFDLYNEPQDVSDAVWHDGGTVTSHGVTYDAPGMQTLYDTVRATGATNLVFASGSGWASAFPATAPLTGASNLVYAAHAYTCPSGLPADGATCNPGPAGIEDPSALLDAWSAVSASAPVMVTEFGFPDKYDGQYVAALTSGVTQRGWVGWDVYAFDNTSAGLFDLVKDTGPLWDPAISGMAVMTGMLDD